MILDLHIENIAVIEKANIIFESGFNVITGETGSGKSVLINAIKLLLGQRAPKDLIRTGCNKAFVSASFNQLNQDTILMLEKLGYNLDEDEILIIQREINLMSNGYCRINSRPASVSVLKQIGGTIINLHGQHENFGLISSKTHLEYIDKIGNLHDKLLLYKNKYDELKKMKIEIDALNIDESEKIKKIDLLKHQIDEIEKCELGEGEEEILKNKKELFLNREKILNGLVKANEYISGKESYNGSLETIGNAKNFLFETSEYFPEIKQIYSRVSDIFYELEDCLSEINKIICLLDEEENDLEYVEDRLDIIYKLTRKYGSNINEILEYLGKSKKELCEIETSEIKLKELESLFLKKKKMLINIADDISKSRAIVCKEFCERIKKELEFLSMKEVEIFLSQEKDKLSSSGYDKIEFLISTNRGEEPKLLSKIASGGELSRIMLAIKSVLSEKDNISTFIFDEIDTGISGSVSQKVGIKLRELSNQKQIICITHSAQIAALANSHFVINKTIKENRTIANIFSLNYEQRKKEIARIIGGIKITQLTLNNASEMLNK